MDSFGLFRAVLFRFVFLPLHINSASLAHAASRLDYLSIQGEKKNVLVQFHVGFGINGGFRFVSFRFVTLRYVLFSFVFFTVTFSTRPLSPSQLPWKGFKRVK